MSGPQKVGLIAGGGALPHEVIIGAKALGYDVFVAVLDGFAKVDDFSDPAKTFGIGEIGRLMKTFKAEKCSHVTMAGIVARPDFKKVKPDFRGVRLLPKVIKAASKGDDALLTFLMSVFEKEGFEILAPQDLCGGVLMEAGPARRGHAYQAAPR